MALDKFFVPEEELWIDEFKVDSVEKINEFLKQSYKNEAIRNVAYAGAIKQNDIIFLIIKYQRRYYAKDFANNETNNSK